MVSTEPVVISYKDFKAGKDFTAAISEAFGADGLGLIVVRDCPDFQVQRKDALLAIREFAMLPDEVKERYTDPISNYSFGWSHGKERMRSGVPDMAKGSYYANPLSNVITEDVSLKERFPELYRDNIWPEEDLPQLESSFRAMTGRQLEVGYMVCELFDRYLHVQTDGVHPLGTFVERLKRGIACKGRLLHYFPSLQPSSSTSEDGLCGWHLDHGGITVLTCPLYLNLEGEEVAPPGDCGLHIKHPVDGRVVKVDLAPDCLLVQLGESFQFLSGGHLRATAHCVKASARPDLTRETLALFMDWQPEEAMKLPSYSLPYDEVVHTPFLPEGVPQLDSRVKNAADYKQFATNTFRAYYAEK